MVWMPAIPLLVIDYILFSLLTTPVIRLIKKSGSKRDKLLFCWISILLLTTIMLLSKLAIDYYAQPLPRPFLNLTLTSGPLATLSSALMVDALSIYMAISFTLLTAIVLIYSIFYIDPSTKFSERYYSIMLMIAGCTLGIAFSGDFLTLFIFWEATAAGSSFLMLYKRSPESLHATLKYLVMIVIASAFIIYGLSMVYALTGTLNFWAVKRGLVALGDKRPLETAFALILAGYAIEAAIAPFHMWLPDAYTAAPSSSSAFLSAIVDQGSYYVLLRVLEYILTPPSVLEWRYVLSILSALTMVMGNLLALGERDVKRLFAYICIVDVGQNLVAISSVTPLGIMGNLYFFLVGGMSTALSFMAIGIFENSELRTLDDFSGVGRKMPLASVALLSSALSLAGVPPFAGFVAKYLVFTSAIEANMSWLAVVGVVTSVVQAAYFLRLINYMYAKAPKNDAKAEEPTKLLIPALALTAVIVVLAVFPDIVLNLTESVVQQFVSMP